MKEECAERGVVLVTAKWPSSSDANLFDDQAEGKGDNEVSKEIGRAMREVGIDERGERSSIDRSDGDQAQRFTFEKWIGDLKRNRYLKSSP